MRDREMRFLKTSFIGYTGGFVKDIFGERTLIAAAHPDDGVAGAGALYGYLEKAVFIHVTDGAPRDLVDARAQGFRSAEEYSRARRRELVESLALAGVGPEDCMQAGVPDREAAFRLAEIALKLRDIMRETEPESVLTLPYEGGHPDHDSVSFCVCAAARLLKKDGVAPPPLIEYSMYHSLNGGFTVLDFIPREGYECITVMLTEEERRLKGRMMDRFTTQSGELRAFPMEHEKFRAAPPYDFSAPPHAGRLHYEGFDWGMDGREWRDLASRALRELGIGGAG